MYFILVAQDSKPRFCLSRDIAYELAVQGQTTVIQVEVNHPLVYVEALPDGTVTTVLVEQHG
jgi:hypothetical protein